jgi:hypothetical protein
MKMFNQLFICIATLLLIVPTAWSADLTIPHSFTSGAKAMASEVNTNFKALETEVNDNDSRIADLEAERSYTVFALGEALQFLPGSSVTVDDILAKAQRIYDLTVNQYMYGNPIRVDEICQWSKRWQGLAYLAASDDAGRPTAFEDHFKRSGILSTFCKCTCRWI